MRPKINKVLRRCHSRTPPVQLTKEYLVLLWVPITITIWNRTSPREFVQNQHKGVNWRFKDVSQTPQQRPKSHMITVTWHSSKYKVHKLHQGYTPQTDALPPPSLSVTLRRRHRCAQAYDRTNIYLFETWHRSLSLCLCDVFLAPISSLVCWFCTSALGLIQFQIVPIHSEVNMCISVFICWASFQIKW